MDDLKSYFKNRKSNFSSDNEKFSQSSDGAGNSANFREQKKNIEDVINGYATKSNDELFAELLREVDAKKASGDFSVERLDEFCAKVKPMLDAEQSKRLDGIIQVIKNR